jgi:nucleoredoxin
MRISILVVLLILTGFWIFHGKPSPSKINWLAQLNTGNLVQGNGDPCRVDAVPSKAYTFIYFSASWCQPCHAFTPSLVNFFNSAGKKRNFDVVMVSYDHEQDDLTAYAEEFHMPWIFARMQSPLAKQLNKTYANTGIPDLVLIDRNGKILADSFSGSDYLGPEHVLDEYRKL